MSDAVKQPTLSELETRAAADLKARAPGTLTAWAFLHARAAGERVIRDRALKRLEDEQWLVLHKAAGYEMEAARELILANAPGELAMYRAEVALADAVAAEVATKTVLDLLARPAKPATQLVGHVSGNSIATKPAAMSKRP